MRLFRDYAIYVTDCCANRIASKCPNHVLVIQGYKIITVAIILGQRCCHNPKAGYFTLTP